MTGDAVRTGVEIRRATGEDVPALADTLAAAFASYGWTRWVVPATDHEARLRALYRVYLDVATRFGEVWTTADRAGAAAWTSSADAEAMGRFLTEHGLDRRIAELTGDRAAAAQLADQLLAPHRPQEPHWTLAAVGVDPERQGSGLGTRLIRPMLERCDAEGALAALETSSPGNVRLYERLGFAVTGEVEVPAGPRVWLMRRRPTP